MDLYILLYLCAQLFTDHCQQEMLQVGINSVHGDPSVSNQQRTHQAGCAGSCPTYGQQLLCNRSLVGRMKREEGENAEVKEEEEAEPAIPFAAAYTSSTNDFSQHMCEPSKRLKSSLGTDRLFLFSKFVPRFSSCIKNGFSCPSFLIIILFEFLNFSYGMYWGNRSYYYPR